MAPPNPCPHGHVLEALSPVPKELQSRNRGTPAPDSPVFLCRHRPLEDPSRSTGKLLEPIEKFKKDIEENQHAKISGAPPYYGSKNRAGAEDSFKHGFLLVLDDFCLTC